MSKTKTQVLYSGFETLNEALDAHAKWLRGEDGGRRADLSGAKLSGAKLSGANLTGANLSGANLSGANLTRAKLTGANLTRAKLTGAKLVGANFYGANFSGADLSGAKLSGANLVGANFSGANLFGANLTGAKLMQGLTWEQYLSDVVPALCTAGGKTLEDVAAGWDCHDWTNCPMHIAFDAPSIEDVPPLYRREAELFIAFFDAKLIPNPIKPVVA